MEADAGLLLQTDRRQDSLLVAVSALIVGLGVVLWWNEWPGALWLGAVFTLPLSIGLLQGLARCSSLSVTAEGFEIRYLFRRRSYRWRDVSEFRVEHLGPLECVVFGRGTGRSLDLPPAFLAPVLEAREVAIPQTYGLKAAELAAMLNEHRVNATAH
jgi:hypothetical protein